MLLQQPSWHDVCISQSQEKLKEKIGMAMDRRGWWLKPAAREGGSSKEGSICSLWQVVGYVLRICVGSGDT